MRLVDARRKELRQAKQSRRMLARMNRTHPRGVVVLPSQRCRNCGRPGKHFCPPSMGEPGFYACEAFK